MNINIECVQYAEEILWGGHFMFSSVLPAFLLASQHSGELIVE